MNAERSEDDSPSVTINFPDGYSDQLVLNKFYTNDEDRLEADDNSCAYIGHLKNEVEACVALTGCFGQDDVLISVMSSHAQDSGGYVWKADGSVTVLENPIKVKLR